MSFSQSSSELHNRSWQEKLYIIISKVLFQVEMKHSSIYTINAYIKNNIFPNIRRSRHGVVLRHPGMPEMSFLDLPVTKRWSPLPQIKHQGTKFNGHFLPMFIGWQLASLPAWQRTERQTHHHDKRNCPDCYHIFWRGWVRGDALKVTPCHLSQQELRSVITENPSISALWWSIVLSLEAITQWKHQLIVSTPSWEKRIWLWRAAELSHGHAAVARMTNPYLRGCWTCTQISKN